MSILLQSKQVSRFASYKKNALSSICLIPIAVMLPMTAHADLTNVATVTGTPAFGTLPSNITATETVAIASPISATAEVFPAINGTDGGVTTSVLASDMLNGVAVDPADVTLTVGTSDPELTLDPATGLITVAPGTAAGTYTVEYTICEVLNPTNCATITEEIVVESAPIEAGAPEVFPAINGTDGGVTGSVLTSDMLNGVAVDPDDVTLTVGDILDADGNPVTGVTLDPDTGLITVAAGTPAGTYTVEYTVCEDLNPTNCVTSTETVTVEAAPIEASTTPTVYDAINGTDGGETPSVLEGQTLNGEPINPDDVTLTGGAILDEDGNPSTALSFDPDTGVITVAADTPAGTYTVEYTVCEVLNPTNCATITEEIVVGAAPIEALPDSIFGISSSEGAENVLNVLVGDTLNGVAVTSETVTVTIAPDLTLPNVASSPGYTLPEGIIFNADGSFDVAPGTPVGTYVVEYQICETLNPDNCAVSTATIGVEPSVASVSGTVYLDENSNGVQDGSEHPLAGWIVEILDAEGRIVSTISTDENGYYEQGDLPIGEYSVVFRNPDNNTLYGQIKGVQLDGGDVIIDQNLPIDPSGVVYDAVTRVPVENTLLTFVDVNGNALPSDCFVDPSQQNQLTDNMGMYRFDIVPGADASCPFAQTNYSIVFDAPESHVDTNSTIIGSEPGFLSTDAGTGPLLVSPLATAPQAGDATTHYFGFTLGQGSRDVINNHIPLDPITLVRSDMNVVKSTPRKDVNFGDLVPYTITVTNTDDLPRIDLDLIDFIPPGFKYVEETSRLDGVAVEPEVSGRNLILNDYDFASEETKTWTMMLVVGAGVSDGIYTNQAYIRDTLGAEVSPRAEAVVRVSPDPLFDCAELIGKVFDDENQDGYQDQDEPGMAGVRLATAKGLLITTDNHGRYHVACAAIPNGQIGSNFVLKLDERTLPTGYHMTSENPRVVRLTRGKMSKANFGTALENIVKLDVTDAAFEGASNTLKPEFASQLGSLIESLKDQESTLRLTYHASANGREDRINELGSQIQDMWKVHGGDYDLEIERKTIWSGDAHISKTGGEE